MLSRLHDTTCADPTTALTLGAQRVGLDFNPSSNSTVYRIMRAAALIDDTINDETGDPRLKALAMTAAKEAAMWVNGVSGPPSYRWGNRIGQMAPFPEEGHRHQYVTAPWLSGHRRFSPQYGDGALGLRGGARVPGCNGTGRWWRRRCALVLQRQRQRQRKDHVPMTRVQWRRTRRC